MVIMMNYEKRCDQFLDRIDSGELDSNWNSVLENLIIDNYNFNTPRLKNLLKENGIYVNEETIDAAIKEKQFSPDIREPILTTLLELHYDRSSKNRKNSQRIMEVLTNKNAQYIDHPLHTFPKEFNENSEYEKVKELFNLVDDQVPAFIQYLMKKWDITLAEEDDFNNIFRPPLSEIIKIGTNTPTNFLYTITDIPTDLVLKLLTELQDMGLFKQILHQKYRKEFYKSPKTTLDSLTEEINIIESKQNGDDYLEYLNKIQEDLYAIQDDLNFKYIFRVSGQRTLKERFEAGL